MGKVIAARLLQFPFILAVIYLLTFLLVWNAPGDPFQRGDKSTRPEVKAHLERKFHAQSGLQFLGWYSQRLFLHADFGESMIADGYDVNTIIARTLPVSVVLGLAALALATFVGVGVGTLSAVYRDGAFDWGSTAMTLAGISLPSFVTATALLMLAAGTSWMPLGGWGHVSDIILPAIALSLGPMAYIVRLTRVSMLDVMASDFVRTARAKGLSKSVVVWRHCLRNAFLPVLSFLGPAAAATLTGSFVVEKVFNIPGIGRFFVDSVTKRDRTLILGVVMVYSVFLLLFNLLVDIAYAWVDPRIDLSAKKA